MFNSYQDSIVKYYSSDGKLLCKQCLENQSLKNIEAITNFDSIPLKKILPENYNINLPSKNLKTNNSPSFIHIKKITNLNQKDHLSLELGKIEDHGNQK